MKIRLGNAQGTFIETSNEVTLFDVFSGVGIQTDAGLFGIAQRDGGIEVMLEGKTLATFVSNESLGGEVWKAAKEQADALVGVDTPEAAFRRGQEAARASVINMIEDPGRWRAGALSSSLIASVFEVATKSGYYPPPQAEPHLSIEECKQEIRKLKHSLETVCEQRDVLIEKFIPEHHQANARELVNHIHTERKKL